jgi:chemotaxis-related protein WspB
MLFLLFSIGKDRYVIEANRIIEVAPLVELRSLPQSPRGLAGVMNYRGKPVPVLDLCQLTSERPASERLSTRIIILKHPAAKQSERLIGLIAERVTQVMHKEPGEFVSAQLNNANAPYLGPIILDAAGAIQWIDAERLLSEEFRRLVFSDSLALSA